MKFVDNHIADKTKHAFFLHMYIYWNGNCVFCLPYQWRARSHKYIRTHTHICKRQKQTQQKQWGRHFGYLFFPSTRSC